MAEDFSRNCVYPILCTLHCLLLCEHENIEIMLIGGVLNKITKVITGNKVIEQLQDMNVECCILGLSSISSETGITYPLSDEALLKREIINHSKNVMVIANKHKFGSVSTFKTADISAIDILITDETDEEILQKYRIANIKIISVV